MCKVCFVQLHNHSCYSERDAHSRIDKLIDKAIENKQKAIGLTDHGAMHGIPEFMNLAKQKGIKGIAGFEGYMTIGDRADKTEKHYHQLLLAKNEVGFRNLMKLSSIGFIDGFHGRPRFSFDDLVKHSEGLVITSSCLAGVIPQAILNGDYKYAKKLIRKFDALKDFYLEVQPTPMAEQKIVNDFLFKASLEEDVPLLATCDVHYVDKEDMTAHMGMLCLARKATMDDPPMYPSEESYWLKGSKQVFIDFISQGYPKDQVIEAMNNTGKVADEVDFELKKDKDLLPVFPLEGDTTSLKQIQAMIKDGLKRKIPKVTTTYVERVKFELGVISQKGYIDYFLIVADAIKWCKEQGILINFGRGSGAGSLVAYLLDITEVDPIKHGLFFERFLDITRQKMPDIDTDIQSERRHELFTYLKEKYGYNRVAQVTNYTRMSAKSAFKNALMIYDVPFGKAQEITNLIPSKMLIEEVYQVVPKLAKIRKETVETKQGKRIPLEDVFKMAEAFEGVISNTSIHAGGILITPDDLTNHFPLHGTKEETAVQWNKDDVEEMGGVKFDFLGLKTLSIVGSCLESIKKETGKDLDIYEIARRADDPEVYERISKGLTSNSFQLNSSGMRDLCKKVKPTEFKHIVAINALYRPPALASGDTWRYANIKNGQEEERYSHPEERQITGETYGVITYQEHVMQLVHHFAGWDYGRGDKLRKMSAEQLEELRMEFINDAEHHMKLTSYDPKFKSQMNELWDRIVQYMGYGFNKSHGVAYSMLTYLTVYLEHYYPEHYMSAILTSKMSDQDVLAKVFQDIKRENFEVVAPDINKSELSFVASQGKIVFPMGMVSGVGEKAVVELLKHRPYNSLDDLFDRVNKQIVSKRAMKPLVFAGAFDNLHPELTRKEIYIKYLQLKKEKKAEIEEAQQMEWNESIMAEKEKELLGVYVTYNPMDKYHLKPWSSFVDGSTGAFTAGQINKVKAFNDKNGNRMAFASLDTQEGVRELVIFSHIYASNSDLIKKNKKVMAEGKRDGEKLIVNTIKELD
ncbi:DNA polymerase III [Bacillus phage Blastoid]|uniref:DNA-directed DNA polymerase n=1 Tax=Bacillus phage Blastoid TaxID=2880540 RepID=U5PWL2_9CAUD|nr:DNA polymerase [Bacillus phage Blastoid]AGY46843.1 DNA polymerase III [Bacillus phage Blastoid]